MKWKKFFFVIASSLFLSVSIYSQSDFKIVFVAQQSMASNTTWLTKIATDWGATGVSIRVLWG